ncbi:hypothetical protein [Pseudoroseicyclus aestuarii]|uniref:Uncharacterized protein n=1 Tax=Pseudoroseicyclus aestuarii TaxID=1795041 RepID=A0A318SND5_9RHOB|nr:hypothetical protein [Pseudoroseicyclus aestuarii]PYE82206.1 hypothetical protein DFP88_10546 [Pseudoroseicyclus aestuarii]
MTLRKYREEVARRALEEAEQREEKNRQKARDHRERQKADGLVMLSQQVAKDHKDFLRDLVKRCSAVLQTSDEEGDSQSMMADLNALLEKQEVEIELRRAEKIVKKHRGHSGVERSASASRPHPDQTSHNPNP